MAKATNKAKATPNKAAKRTISEAEYAMGLRARMVAIVMVATIVIWMGLQWFFSRADVSARVALLFDLLALAAFVWVSVNIYWIWRARQAEKE